MQMRGDADAESISKQTNKADRKRRSAHPKKKRRKRNNWCYRVFFLTILLLLLLLLPSVSFYTIFFTRFFFCRNSAWISPGSCFACTPNKTKDERREATHRCLVFFGRHSFFFNFFFFFFRNQGPRTVEWESEVGNLFLFSFLFFSYYYCNFGFSLFRPPPRRRHP